VRGVLLLMLPLLLPLFLLLLLLLPRIGGRAMQGDSCV
jgi:hypothetical protein